METLFQDLRFGLRSLLRAPGFAAASIITLALGIAATTVVFSLINMMLLRPIPAHEPERLFMLNDQPEGGRISMNGYTAIPESRLRSYQDVGGDMVAGMAGMRWTDMALRTDEGAEIVDGMAVTADYFDVLGVPAATGRVFSAAEDGDGESVAVISHAMWQDHFAGDPGVVGSTLYLDGHAHTVVGVAREGYRGTSLGATTNVWVPLETYVRLHPTDPEGFERGELYIVPFGRMADDVELSTLQAALAAAAPNLPHPNPDITTPRTELESMTLVDSGGRREVVPFLAMFFATALLVLLIAATNVTGMLLARATGRAREVAVRVAVGADRSRIVRQLVTEGVLVFLLGAAGALLLTFWLASALPALLPAEIGEVLGELRPDGRVLGFGLGLALVSGLAFTIVPALQVSRTDLVGALKDGSAGAGSRRMRLRTTFVVAQVAMSFVLLIVAGLFARTIRQSVEGDMGFDPHGVVTAGVRPGSQGYDGAAGRRLAEDLLARVKDMPGVESAALTVFPPMAGWVWNTTLTTPERAAQDAEELVADIHVVAPQYFETMRIPLLAGRDFNSGDVEGSPEVAIINQALADTLWPGENVIGRRFDLDGTLVEVVGVTPTGKYRDMRDTDLPVFYRPLAQNNGERYTVLARTSGDPAPLLSAMRSTLAQLDPDLALENAMRFDDLIVRTLVPQRMAATLIGTFGLIGLLLASIGLYGVLAYHVGQRTREIGIRIALGARARAVISMIMRHGARLAFIGVSLGIVAAVALTRFLQSMLVGVSATDGATFGVVVLLLLIVAMLASWVPARRATRVNPTIALRSE
ncbi:MAG TPA: ABC transporter permease [Longimicrobiales bacterium]